jgi:hypothetical protein
MNYRIFAAVASDVDAGWVWISAPRLPSRCVVRIVNPSNKAVVYCEALQIDENFLSAYNCDGRCTINRDQCALVINAWYRKRLGDIPTQSDQDLNVVAADNPKGKLLSCLQHPQVVIRMGMWLAILSVLLGLLGVALGLLSLRT